MKIQIAQNVDRHFWDAYVLNHPHGLAYHLFAWKMAVKNAYGFEAVYLMAKARNRIVGVLPVIIHGFPFMFSRLVSLPYCDAGGPLADSVDIERELLLKAIHLSAKFSKFAGTVTIRSSNSFAGIDPLVTINREKARMLLHLPNNSKVLLASLKAKVRSQVKKPLRDGLTAEIGGKALLPEFYPLFAENMKDLGSPVHSRKWLQSILGTYRNRAHLVLVRMPDGTPAAGGIILCHSRTVSVPWASSLRRFNRWNPNMLLYWTFLEFASDNGYKNFDFGRSTPGEGTFKFKKQWGAHPVFLHWADFHAGTAMPVLRSVSASSGTAGPLRKAGEYFFMNLPISLSRGIAPLVRRYISL